MFSSPNNMGSWSWKRFRASFRSVNCSRVEGGMYLPMSGFRLSVTTSQITTSVLWKHVDYILQPWGCSRTTSPTPPCASPSTAVISCNHTTMYPILLQQYNCLVILVSIRIIRSKPPIRAYQTACPSLGSRPSRML